MYVACRVRPPTRCTLTLFVPLQGVVENSISSSFTTEQWLEWLDKSLVDEHL